jgi:hypothetical protein
MSVVTILGLNKNKALFEPLARNRIQCLEIQVREEKNEKQKAFCCNAHNDPVFLLYSHFSLGRSQTTLQMERSSHRNGSCYSGKCSF